MTIWHEKNVRTSDRMQKPLMWINLFWKLTLSTFPACIAERKKKQTRAIQIEMSYNVRMDADNGATMSIILERPFFGAWENSYRPLQCVSIANETDKVVIKLIFLRSFCHSSKLFSDGYHSSDAAWLLLLLIFFLFCSQFIMCIVWFNLLIPYRSFAFIAFSFDH